MPVLASVNEMYFPKESKHILQNIIYIFLQVFLEVVLVTMLCCQLKPGF